jgi:ADP-dependent NAD(P)H-hydrate dehydratase / NAD(P)H-hydrate epimerase
MIPVATPDEKRAADESADVPVATLIDRAGSGVARVAIAMLGGRYGRTVNVLAGPGNNGADGRVAADRLAAEGVRVRVFDALDAPPELPPSDLVIDAAFGSGFRDTWRCPEIGAAKLLAVDVPTGLDGGTGVAADHTRRADATVTFGAPSPGHHVNDGPRLVGDLHVVDIGLRFPSTSIHIVEASDVAAWVPERASDAHKWADGVRVVAGSTGMTGAAHLAAASAMRAGSGMVAVSSPGIDADAPTEVVDRRIPPFDWSDAVQADLHRYHALVIGPGLGREEYTIPSVVTTVLEAVVPTVVDGDALFALSWNEEGNPSFLAERAVPTVLTPHDGEYGLLTGRRPGPDRIAAAHHLARLAGAVVLLKGPTTVVADAEGHTLLVTNGSERLATAGTGDVLAGLVGAFLARGAGALQAAAAAAWVHADAAARCGVGLVAGDLLPVIPQVIESCRAS